MRQLPGDADRSVAVVRLVLDGAEERERITRTSSDEEEERIPIARALDVALARVSRDACGTLCLPVEPIRSGRVVAAVPRNVRLSEAPSHGKPVMLYDLRCPGAKSYMAVADEFLERTLIQQAPKGQPAA